MLVYLVLMSQCWHRHIITFFFILMLTICEYGANMLNLDACKQHILLRLFILSPSVILSSHKYMSRNGIRVGKVQADEIKYYLGIGELKENEQTIFFLNKQTFSEYVWSF